MFPFFNPQKTPENQRFSGVSKGYKMGTLARKRLKIPFVFNTDLKIEDKLFLDFFGFYIC